MNRSDARKQLARKYARAFLRSFPDSVTEQCLLQSVARLTTCYEENKRSFYTLALSSAHIEERCQGLAKLLNHFEVPEKIHLLIEVMLRKKKLGLFPFLLPALIEEFRKRNDLQEVHVSTAQPLSPTEQARLEKSMQERIPGSLSFVYTHDPSLIAGIKVQTKTHYWEESLARTIRTLEHRLQLQEKV